MLCCFLYLLRTCFFLLLCNTILLPSAPTSTTKLFRRNIEKFSPLPPHVVYLPPPRIREGTLHAMSCCHDGRQEGSTAHNLQGDAAHPSGHAREGQANSAAKEFAAEILPVNRTNIGYPAGGMSFGVQEKSFFRRVYGRAHPREMQLFGCLRDSVGRLRRDRRYGWLRMVFPRWAPLPISNLVPFRRWWHARGRGYCRGEPGNALSGGYAPDSARLEGSSIVGEPGEC